jgi:PDZ domain-containing protein
VLEAGDVIRTFDGTEVSDVSTLRTLIADHGTSSPASIGIERGGAASEVQVTPADNNGTAVIGVELSSDYDFPFDVKIQLENVGGPSAGQMFALGIIDKLTPGALTGGADVAGTGTISASGDIGAIGGIRQKLYGAKDAGADYFLAPTTNCDEVTGHVPSGLTVFAVATLDDSLTALETVASGGDTSALPTCPAG